MDVAGIEPASFVLFCTRFFSGRHPQNEGNGKSGVSGSSREVKSRKSERCGLFCLRFLENAETARRVTNAHEIEPIHAHTYYNNLQKKIQSLLIFFCKKSKIESERRLYVKEKEETEADVTAAAATT